jgi:hypothetical protein
MDLCEVLVQYAASNQEKAMTTTCIDVEDFEIEIDRDNRTATVYHGKFKGDLHELERTGELKAPNGKTYKVPAWQVGDLVNAAYNNGL